MIFDIASWEAMIFYKYISIAIEITRKKNIIDFFIWHPKNVECPGAIAPFPAPYITALEGSEFDIT